MRFVASLVAFVVLLAVAAVPTPANAQQDGLSASTEHGHQQARQEDDQVTEYLLDDCTAEADAIRYDLEPFVHNNITYTEIVDQSVDHTSEYQPPHTQHHTPKHHLAHWRTTLTVVAGRHDRLF